MMRIFKNKIFSRFARKQKISDEDLKAIIPMLEAGVPDANLGGDVFKVRVARRGEGKRGGYRVIVLFRNGERTFFVYGFAKSAMDNISENELKTFRHTAKNLFSFTDNQLDGFVKTGDIKEVTI